MLLETGLNMPFPINKSVSKSNRTWNYQNFSFIDKGMTLFELFIEGNLPTAPYFPMFVWNVLLQKYHHYKQAFFLGPYFPCFSKSL